MTAPATSPWGTGGSTSGASAWSGGKPRPPRAQNPNQQTQPSTGQGNAVGGQPVPQTFAQMQQSGQARPAPTDQTQQPAGGGLAAQTASQLSASSASPSFQTFQTPTSVPGQAPLPQSVANTLQANAPQIQPPDGAAGGVTYPATSPTVSAGGTPSASFAPAPVAGPAVDAQGQLTSAVQSALQNPDPYASQTMQAQEKAGQATLAQQYAAQQKMLDEQMAARGIGASSIASGYYGDLAGQQATALAGLQSNVLTDEANRYQQGIATALGAGNTLAGTQGAQNLGAAQLGTQASLGAGSLALGGRQLDQQGSQFNQSQAQQLGEFNTSDTTANRGLDIQNATNNNALNLQVASLLAQMGYSPQGTSTSTTGAPPPSQPPSTGGNGNPAGGTTGNGGGGGSGQIVPPDSSGGGANTPGGGAFLFGPAYSMNGAIPANGASLSAQTAAQLGGNAGAASAGGANVGTAPRTGLPAQTAANLGSPPTPVNASTPGAVVNPKGMLPGTYSPSGNSVSGDSIIQDLLSLPAQQQQDKYGFSIPKDPKAWTTVGTADSTGNVVDSQGHSVANAPPGQKVYSFTDPKTGHVQYLDQNWFSKYTGG